MDKNINFIWAYISHHALSRKAGSDKSQKVLHGAGSVCSPCPAAPLMGLPAEVFMQLPQPNSCLSWTDTKKYLHCSVQV